MKNINMTDMMEKMSVSKTELFTNIKKNKPLPKLNPMLTKPIEPIKVDTSELDASLEEIARKREDEERVQSEFRDSVVNALKGIEKNTSVLTEMTLLLQKSNDKQDEMFALMIEILEIMKSSSKEEADSKFTTVMKKITTISDNANTIQSLIGMANTVYNAYQSLPLP
jgi:hypothetical protein